MKSRRIRRRKTTNSSEDSQTCSRAVEPLSGQKVQVLSFGALYEADKIERVKIQGC